MALITLHNVTVGFGNAPVLETISLSVEPGARACVTGRNGEGKSTLLKVIAGLVPPDAGEVLRDAATRVAYLPQDVPEDRPGTVRDLLRAAVGEADRAHVAEALMTRLGLPPEQDFNALSGGLRRRVLLGCALAQEPHVLLLDEPTNHLDVESIRWLEGFLASAPFACLFVTHDRAFLRAVARTVFDLDRGLLSGWDCDYPTFLRRKAELLADEAVYWERKSKKLSEEEAWLRRGVKARTCRNEGRVAALMRLRQEFAGRRAQVGSATLSLGAEGRAGDIVYRCEGVTFGYDPERPILRDVSLRILRGERIGILGSNGAGKTTLLNLLLGRLTPQSGSQRLGANVKPAFFDQLRDALNPEATVAENVAEGKEFVTVGGARKHLFGYLGDFLFTPERARTPVKALSGGERARLLLARLFLNPGNLLVMDEPTNDLDIETLELLEEQLANYGGTTVRMIVGDTQINIQGLLDGILPKLIPLLITLGLYVLIKKGWTPVKCILLILVCGIVGCAFGIWTGNSQAMDADGNTIPGGYNPLVAWYDYPEPAPAEKTGQQAWDALTAVVTELQDGGVAVTMPE